MLILLGTGCAMLAGYSLIMDQVHPDVGRHKSTLVYMALAAVLLMSG